MANLYDSMTGLVNAAARVYDPFRMDGRGCGMSISRTLIMALAAVTPLAHADWQYTRWGMSPADVVAASGGAVQVVEPIAFPNIGRSIKAKGPYTAGDLAFNAAFYFSQDDKLVMIGLGQHGVGECSQTQSALSAKYGAPTDTGQRDRKRLIWRDEATGTAVEWTDTSALNRLTASNKEIDCFISYQPLEKAAEGL